MYGSVFFQFLMLCSYFQTIGVILTNLNVVLAIYIITSFIALFA